VLATSACSARCRLHRHHQPSSSRTRGVTCSTSRPHRGQDRHGGPLHGVAHWRLGPISRTVGEDFARDAATTSRPSRESGPPSMRVFAAINGPVRVSN